MQIPALQIQQENPPHTDMGGFPKPKSSRQEEATRGPQEVTEVRVEEQESQVQKGQERPIRLQWIKKELERIKQIKPTS